MFKLKFTVPAIIAVYFLDSYTAYCHELIKKGSSYEKHNNSNPKL